MSCSYLIRFATTAFAAIGSSGNRAAYMFVDDAELSEAIDTVIEEAFLA
jgi:hypothetical protein